MTSYQVRGSSWYICTHSRSWCCNRVDTACYINDEGHENNNIRIQLLYAYVAIFVAVIINVARSIDSY